MVSLKENRAGSGFQRQDVGELANRFSILSALSRTWARSTSPHHPMCDMLRNGKRFIVQHFRRRGRSKEGAGFREYLTQAR